jgi:hypothetical protein
MVLHTPEYSGTYQIKCVYNQLQPSVVSQLAVAYAQVGFIIFKGDTGRRAHFWSFVFTEKICKGGNVLEKYRALMNVFQL